MNKLLPLFPVLAAALAAVPALAASSQWVETDGGRVRLVTTGKPDAHGRLTGILDIELKPGWKTYWRDPGDAGVPPQVDISGSSNIASAELDFPAPQRHDDGYATWAGYDYPVAFPITFTVPSPDAPIAIEASVFLGICETICIPVQATLSLDPEDDADNPADATAVSVALAALPTAETPGFRATLHAQGDQMTIEVSAPGDLASADFFLAAPEGYSFAQPKRIEKDGRLSFTVAILDRPTVTPTQGGLAYTLVSDAGAVSGLLPYP